MMAGITGKNTKPEFVIRRGLHALGYRFRLHAKDLPGRPDIVFRSKRAVIFVNGCFWHGHDCHLFRWPGTRQEFWQEKIAGNIARDERTRTALAIAGWRICEIWECALKGKARWPVDEVLERVTLFLEGGEARLVIGDDRTVHTASNSPVPMLAKANI